MDVVLVEGAVANEENLEMIHTIRRDTQMLVSFGDCAVTGNVTALRNPLGGAEPSCGASTSRTATCTPQIPDEPGIVPRAAGPGACRCTPSCRSITICPAARRRPRASERCSKQLLAGKTAAARRARDLKFG